MTPNSTSARTSAKALRRTIDTLTKLDRRWRKTASKRALYRYLAAVFNLYAAWKDAGVTGMAAIRIARLAGSSARHGRHPMRIVIDATSTADRKSKSRWTQALRFAWRERSQWNDLSECLRLNGGVAGYAGRWADQQPMRTPPGFVRIGGEDRFPRIPFFVDVTLLDQYGDFVRQPR